MTPTFRIVADGADITALINDRLLLLRTTDKPGMESDDFELRIDDRDSAVSLPSRGASIEVFLGYNGSALTRLGRYTVDEVELSGPPDTLVIRGKASDMRGSGKTTRSGSWEGVSLASIITDVAARNGWSPVCSVTTVVPRADQLNESDFNFITRLSKQFDCTAKVADGKLLVMQRQGGQSAGVNVRASLCRSLSSNSSRSPEADGDGQIYRGRGLIQITGRANYMMCSEALALDLINQPELLEKPQHACMSAAWFWASRGLNTLADTGQFDTITRRINGGQNGASDRQALYARALKVLA